MRPSPRARAVPGRCGHPYESVARAPSARRSASAWSVRVPVRRLSAAGTRLGIDAIEFFGHASERARSSGSRCASRSSSGGKRWPPKFCCPGQVPAASPTVDLHTAATGIAIHSNEAVSAPDGGASSDTTPACRAASPPSRRSTTGHSHRSPACHRLTAAEARAVDLHGSYRQIYLGDQFEHAIAGIITRRSP
jgi:hypothetical protein